MSKFYSSYRYFGDPTYLLNLWGTNLFYLLFLFSDCYAIVQGVKELSLDISF